MLNWLYCCLSGGHEYGVYCEPQSIYLRCLNCGKRSSGWDLHGSVEIRRTTAPRAAHPIPHSAAVLSNVVSFASQRALR